MIILFSVVLWWLCLHILICVCLAMLIFVRLVMLLVYVSEPFVYTNTKEQEKKTLLFT